jgi:hypothetical protein
MLNEKDLQILYMRENGRWPMVDLHTPLGLPGALRKQESSHEPYIRWLEEKLISFMKSYTCSECVEVTTCKFAFDHYNTNGDCLAIK